MTIDIFFVTANPAVNHFLKAEKYQHLSDKL